MQSFLMALSVVGPLIVYMVVGRIIRMAKMFSADNFRALNQLLFHLFIPFTLFFNIYHANLGETVQPGLFALVEVLLVGSCVAAWFLIKSFVKDKPDCATIVQGIFRSNYVLFGGMMAEALCTQAGVALSSALAALVVPTVNIGGVVLFELVRGGELKPGALFLRILKNPLVEAGILGIVCNLLSRATGIYLSEVIQQPLMKLGSAATPIALVTLGGLLSFGSMQKHRRWLAVTVAGKLMVVPLIAVLTGILLGYRGDELVVILAVFGSPTAVASAPMAQAMGGNGDLAGEIVATTTVTCVFTIFVFVFVLSRMGMI